MFNQFIYLISYLTLLMAQPEEPLNNQRAVRNIILMIGDGMGVSQMSAAFYFNKDNKKPNFTRLPVTGLITTSSCSEKITDSAAGATAFASGKKTSNGKVGVDQKNEPLESLTDYFSRRDMKIGLVATSTITHATPAAFYAHEKNRHREDRIARQLPGSEVDYFAGGGWKHFTTGGNANLLEELRSNGFIVDTNSLPTTLQADNKYGFLLDEGSMPMMAEGRGSFLKDASMLGIDLLNKNKEGFFMMIEASQIDWGGHARNSEYLIGEVLDFDDAVGAVLDFAEEDGNTLVIVTADHETGGFTLGPASKKVPFQGEKPDYNELEPIFSNASHSATLVPVLAYGPGAEKFSGIYPNTEIHQKILELIP